MDEKRNSEVGGSTECGPVQTVKKPVAGGDFPWGQQAECGVDSKGASLRCDWLKSGCHSTVHGDEPTLKACTLVHAASVYCVEKCAHRSC
jgi:hypothetical protein